MKTNIKAYSDKQLLDRVAELYTFRGFPTHGFLDIWVRSNEDEFDRFDDKVYTFKCSAVGLPIFQMVSSGTSNAGAVGLKHYARYNSKGCAVLKADVIVYNSHQRGLHKGKYPAYKQAVGFPYYRDNDKDNKAEEIGKEYNDIIGANCHKAGWKSSVIGGWSVACLVRNVQAEFDKWMSLLNGAPLTVAILKEF